VIRFLSVAKNRQKRTASFAGFCVFRKSPSLFSEDSTSSTRARLTSIEEEKIDFKTSDAAA
jgi:hypothetical protein